jgi:protein-tyrosine phosphatase
MMKFGTGAREIVPGLWLGDAGDAIAWPWSRLFVGEDPPERYGYYAMRKDDAHVRVLHVDDVSRHHVAPMIVAEKAKLDEAVEIIRARMSLKTPLLVHCHAGIERSPLTVSYFLWKARYASSFDDAFNLVSTKRPQAAYRGSWLPRELREKPSGAK